MGGTRRAAAAALIAVALAGCWPAPGHDANRSGFNDLETAITTGNVATLGVAWEHPVGWIERGEFPTLHQERAGHPIVSNTGLVTVTTPSSVTAFDPATGARAWQRGDVYDPQLRGDLTATGAVLVAGTGNGRFSWTTSWLDAATGAPLSDRPRFVPGVTVRGDLGAGTTTLPSSGGGTTWLRLVYGPTTPGATSLTASLWLGPSTDYPGGGGVTIGPDQLLYAGPGLRATTPGDGTHVNALRAFPTTGGDHTCGPATHAQYLCPTWVSPALDATTVGGPVLSPDGATAYVVTTAGTAYAMSTTDGAIRWSAPVGATVLETPALAYGRLYLPTEGGPLVALDAATGALAWATPAAGAALTVQPAVAGGVVFTGDADGTVAAHDVDTGSLLWSDELGSPITGAPAVTLGKVFVGTEDGRLVAYEPAP
jgi:outer membrane protein assembly factor BamB